MKLWTLQGKDFAIESTSVDHTKSDYYNNVINLPNVQNGYHRLFGVLKTDKFLWCFPLKRFFHEHNKVLYELEVPENEILVYICGCVWHKFITNCQKFDNRDCINSLWKRNKDVDDYKTYLEQQNRMCFSREPEEQLWNRLLWPQPTTIACPGGIKIPTCQKLQTCSALIKSPIDKKWIINKC